MSVTSASAVERDGAIPDTSWLIARAELTERVIVEAERALGGTVEAGVLHRAAAEAVHELWDSPLTIATFVPVLAMRRIRETVGAARRGA